MYLSLGKINAPLIDLFLFRVKNGETDYIMFILRGLLLMALIVAGGINAYPLKIMIKELFKFELNDKNNLIISLVLTFLPAFIASLFNNIS